MQGKIVIRKKALFVFLVACGLHLFLGSAWAQKLGNVKLGAFLYPPFYSEDHGKVRGIAVDWGEELFRRMDMGTDTKMYPIKRTLRYMESGELDALMILIKTSERQKYMNYTDPVTRVRGLIWSSADRKGGPVNFERLEDLKKYNTGVTLGYSYGHEFDQLLKKMKKVETNQTDLINYRRLVNRKIEIFPGNEIVAKGLVKQYPELRGKLAHSDKSFMEWVLHMVVSKKSPLASRIPDINKVLAELKAEGFIEKTVRKYTE